MDPKTARLALTIQLDDIETYRKALPRSTNNATAFSEAKAFEVLRDELLKKLWEVNGQCAAMQLLRDEHSNQVAFQRLVTEEKQAESDHDMACRLAGVRVAARPPAVANTHVGDAEAARRTDALNGVWTAMGVRVNLDGTQTAAGLPGTAKRPAYQDPADLREQEDGLTKRRKIGDGSQEQLVVDDSINDVPRMLGVSVPVVDKGKSKTSPATHAVCSSCLEPCPKFDVLQLSCKDPDEFENHAYCRECLQALFEASVTDPSLFPPRCCSAIIPLFSCVPFLPKATMARFVERRDELETPNRTYCSDPKCAKWVKPISITAGVATCHCCSRQTCTTCKQKKHDGLCPVDENVKELMNVAEKRRWKTCPACKNMVELAQGCYHITCRCRFEFCYLCLAKWRTCKCELWDERNLVERPAPAVAAAAGVPVQPPNANRAPAQIPAVRPQVIPAIPRAPVLATAQPAAVLPALVQGQNAPRKRKQNQKRGVDFLEHEFKRYYRSNGWDTTCDICGTTDERWVNVCEDEACGLSACWYCSKHRI